MPFVPGLELARGLHADVVAPALARSFPGLCHAAALLGPGSEVLGFDTARSADHDWGPRLQLFLPAADLAAHGDAVATVVAAALPDTYRGYPTAWVHSHDDHGRPRHRVEIAAATAWFAARLGADPAALTAQEWVATPAQVLAELTGGAVFRDDAGELTALRERLAWYPDDVWRHVLAGHWSRIGEEDAFPGRCAEVGDELGAAVVTARLVRDLMRLSLLMARRYPPYPKWLGTAFAGLPDVGGLHADLRAAIAATDQPRREAALVGAYEKVLARHNALGLADPVEPVAVRFFDRPFRVAGAGRVVTALLRAVSDPAVRRLPLPGPPE